MTSSTYLEMYGLDKIIATVGLIFLVTFTLLFTPLEVFAQNTNLGVSILQLTPNTGTGPVGTSINLQGTIYTSNGTYQIVFNKQVVTSGTSEGYYVNANFTVPELPSGTYALILRDAAINVNATQQFTVSIAYSITPISGTVQEGNSVSLRVSVTGGISSTSYGAEVTVFLPNPLSTKYTKSITLGTPNTQGTASTTVTFPDNSFTPSGSLTDYAGDYTAYFNQSQNLAQNTFKVGFIDSTEYHRGQTMSIRATGYQPNEAVTIAITNVAGSSLQTATATASADGIISTTLALSASADVGEYTVRITGSSTQKSIPDSETFNVVGYSVQIKATNLAGDAVSALNLQAQDTSTSASYSAITGSNGIANFKLDHGTYTITATWNGVNVGQTSITVSGDAAFNMQCQLSNVKITVQSKEGVSMPHVTLFVVYLYQSGSGLKTGNASGVTDSSGNFVLNSVYAGSTFTIDASSYGQIFNAGNNTVNSLPIQATPQIWIICPLKTATLTIVGYNQEPISGARIELVELTNGLFYFATADTGGIAQTQATFGLYRIRIYKDNALVNEFTLQIFNDIQQQIRCTIYGIQLTVSVVDFFGSPISNVRVTLNGPESYSQVTSGSGKATFSDIIGGEVQIIAQSQSDQSAYQAVKTTINQPTTVQMKLDKYVALGSTLIQASSLITVLIILLAIILFTFLEIYRRRGSSKTVTA